MASLLLVFVSYATSDSTRDFTGGEGKIMKMIFQCSVGGFGNVDNNLAPTTPIQAHLVQINFLGV